MCALSVGGSGLESNVLWVSATMQLVAIRKPLALPVRGTLLDLRSGGDFYSFVEI